MHRQALLKSLDLYHNSPFFMQEEQKDYDNFIRFITDNPGCFEREHAGHITGSIWLVNHDLTQVLLTHHKKFGIWLQLGGHADGDPHIPGVALKEAHEESGIEGLEFVTAEIYDINIIYSIPNKCKAHYDVCYLIKAPKEAQYTVSEESHDLAWVSFDKIEEYTTRRSVKRMAEKVSYL